MLSLAPFGRCWISGLRVCVNLAIHNMSQIHLAFAEEPIGINAGVAITLKKGDAQ